MMRRNDANPIGQKLAVGWLNCLPCTAVDLRSIIWSERAPFACTDKCLWEAMVQLRSKPASQPVAHWFRFGPPAKVAICWPLVGPPGRLLRALRRLMIDGHPQAVNESGQLERKGHCLRGWL